MAFFFSLFSAEDTLERQPSGPVINRQPPGIHCQPQANGQIVLQVNTRMLPLDQTSNFTMGVAPRGKEFCSVQCPFSAPLLGARLFGSSAKHRDFVSRLRPGRSPSWHFLIILRNFVQQHVPHAWHSLCNRGALDAAHASVGAARRARLSGQLGARVCRGSSARASVGTARGSRCASCLWILAPVVCARGGWRWGRLGGLLSGAGGAHGLSPLTLVLSLNPCPPEAVVPIDLSPPTALDLPVLRILTSLPSVCLAVGVGGSVH